MRQIGALRPPSWFKGTFQGKDYSGQSNTQNSILAQLQAAQERANKANEERYQQALAAQQAAIGKMQAGYGAAETAMAGG